MSEESLREENRRLLNQVSKFDKKNIDLQIKARELVLNNEKLKYAINILMGNSTLPEDELKKIMSDFDSAFNKNQAEEIYKNFLKEKQGIE